jgi:hypothetical protein
MQLNHFDVFETTTIDVETEGNDRKFSQVTRLV